MKNQKATFFTEKGKFKHVTNGTDARTEERTYNGQPMTSYFLQLVNLNADAIFSFENAKGQKIMIEPNEKFEMQCSSYAYNMLAGNKKGDVIEFQFFKGKGGEKSDYAVNVLENDPSGLDNSTTQNYVDVKNGETPMANYNDSPVTANAPDWDRINQEKQYCIYLSQAFNSAVELAKEKGVINTNAYITSIKEDTLELFRDLANAYKTEILGSDKEKSKKGDNDDSEDELPF